LKIYIILIRCCTSNITEKSHYGEADGHWPINVLSFMELQVDYHENTTLLLHPIKSLFIRFHTVTPLFTDHIPYSS